MTSLPAQVFGLADRGRVREGGYADLVLFDPERVRDRATYAEPRLPAEGIERVFVTAGRPGPRPPGTGRLLGPVPARRRGAVKENSATFPALW